MRVAIVGQRDFGKAITGIFIPGPGRCGGRVFFVHQEKPEAGANPDPLPLLASQQIRGIPHSINSPPGENGRGGARRRGSASTPDLCVLAYVLQFAPQDFATIPRHGTLQFHPSLLPRYRGPSSINWPIIRGDTRTGLTMFRPTDGLDEGDRSSCKRRPPSAPKTRWEACTSSGCFRWGLPPCKRRLNSSCRRRRGPAWRDESLASYEGWCREPPKLAHQLA